MPLTFDEINALLERHKQLLDDERRKKSDAQWAEAVFADPRFRAKIIEPLREEIEMKRGELEEAEPKAVPEIQAEIKTRRAIILRFTAAPLHGEAARATEARTKFEREHAGFERVRELGISEAVAAAPILEEGARLVLPPPPASPVPLRIVATAPPVHVGYDIDPGCREAVGADGQLRGACNPEPAAAPAAPKRRSRARAAAGDPLRPAALLAPAEAPRTEATPEVLAAPSGDAPLEPIGAEPREPVAAAAAESNL